MPRAKTPIVGRADDVATLTASMDRVPRGPIAIRIEGEPGIGKTTLWSQGSQHAEERGWTVLSSRQIEAEARLSFQALGDLLDPVLDQALDAAPEPQRRALGIALLREDPGNEMPDQRAVSLATLGVLRRLASAGPLVLAVDDLQWLDAPSARVLAFAFRRFRHEPIGLLATLRLAPGLADPLELDRIVPEHRLARLRVGPMSETDVRSLVRRRLGLELPRPVLRRIHGTSEGNPLFAMEIARLLNANVGRRAAGRPLPIPRDLERLVRVRLGRLSPRARETVVVASAMARPAVDLVSAAVGADDASEGLAEAEREELVEIANGRIRFSHPLFSSAAYTGAFPEERRRVHRRIAEVVEHPEERARHLALAAEGPDPDVASALEAAARHARSRGAPDAAAEFLELARTLTPGEEVEALFRRSFGAAGNHFDAGDPARCRALLDQAVRVAASGAERARALFFLSITSWNDTRSVRAYLLRALEETDDQDLHFLSVVRNDLAWVSLWRGQLARAAEWARKAVDAAERLGAPFPLRLTLATLGTLEVLAGRSSPELMARAVALEGELVTGETATPSTLLGLQRMWAGDLDGARTAFENAHRAFVEQGHETTRHELLVSMSELECRAGNWAAATAHAAQADDIVAGTRLEGLRPATLVAIAGADALRGDIARAGQAATEALARSRRHEDRWTEIRARGVLGSLELSLGRPDAAGDHLEGISDDVDGMGVQEPGVFQVVADEIEALVGLGRLESARELVAPLERQGRSLGRPWAIATAARGRGLIAAARGDLAGSRAALDDALVAHEHVPQPLELGRTLLAAGTIRRRAKEKREARAALERSLAIFDRLGARCWSERARSELGRIGGRPPPPTELTSTERQVAELVSQGSSNKEVADRLFISVRTVEANLTRIYRKLGIRSRTELAAKLLAHPHR